ncbi:hypothetical protein [Tsuneonella sp. HG222]
MSGNAPVKKFRIGAVTASVWKNAGTNGDWHSVTLERVYKDGDELKNTGALNTGDLLNAAKVLERAEAYVSSL